MVSLKYSVGTANKFVGLHVDNDSSDEEENPSFVIEQPSSTPLSSPEENSSIASPNNTSHPQEAENSRILPAENRIPSRNNQNNSQSSKPKGRNGHYNNDIPNEGDKKSDFTQSKMNSSQEKTTRFRKPGIFQGKLKPKKEFTNHISNETSHPKFDKKPSKNTSKEQVMDIPKTEEKVSSNNVTNEKTPDVEDTSKPPEFPTEPVMIDLEEWKQLQASKRSAPFSQEPAAVPTNFKHELEAKGYTLYVKPQELKEIEAKADDQNGEIPKKKASNTLNFYEYIHNSQGHVELFQANRMKTRRGRNPYKSERKPQNINTNDAPDLHDERAFPALGTSRVSS